jgi:hypothetical protein
MTAPKTAEEWGRLAVSLPGWRWMPGMSIPEHGRIIVSWYEDKQGDKWPDPDDPATAGCLLALLGLGVVVAIGPDGVRVGVDGTDSEGLPCKVFGRLESSLGRACIAAAAALGRWPGGS